MTYIIMAIQEEGSEIRVSDYDTHSRGFDRSEEAYEALPQAREDYPEFRRFWVEELKDKEYWMMRHLEDDYFDEEW